MRRALSLLLLCAAPLSAATYYVRKDGSDSNNGLANTSGGAKLTIQAAANLATSAGDVVRVDAGTYLERVAPAASGSSGNLIIFVASGTLGDVKVRGFYGDNDDYIGVINFEMVHDNNALNYSGIRLVNGASYWLILDNYIHNTDHYPIEANDSVGNVIRGNRIEYGHYPVGGPGTGDALIAFSTSAQQLIEYNSMNFGGDFLNSSGANYVYRNNVMGPVRSTATDFPDYGAEHHIDGIQNSQDSPDAVVEANYYTGHATDVNSDAHFVLNQRPNSDRYRVRGNITIRQGAGSQAYRQADGNRHYQNTYVEGNLFDAQTSNLFHYTGEADGQASTGNVSRLNIHDHVCDTGVYYAENGGAIDYDWDVNYNSGSQTQTNGLTNTNPLFSNRATDDLRLQSGSPARIGGHLTLANGSGSNTTTLIVDDATFFVDGSFLSGVLGDEITIGAGALVRIVTISSNTITLAAARTWSDNDVVRWQGCSDAGALPYGMTPLTAATYTTGGTVTPTGDARMVIQYRAGIPINTDTAAPFTFTHTTGDVYKVYALYAQATPVVTATEAGGGGGDDVSFDSITVTGNITLGSP